jgi:hypothetical protein
MLSLITATAACDESDGGDATPVATRSTSSIDIGPVSQETAFATPGQRSLVLEIATGEVFVLTGIAATGWANDEVLMTGTDTRYDLRERRRVVGDFGDPTHARTVRDATSADGEWRLEFDEIEERLVNTATGASMELAPSERQGPSIDGALAAPEFRWSPNGHLLAIGGGLCGDSPLQLVDPDSGTVVILNDEETRVRDYAWTADGKSLAIALVGPEDSQIVLIRVNEPKEATLLAPLPPARMGSHAIGMQWNSSGTRLLFHQFSPRPCPS